MLTRQLLECGECHVFTMDAHAAECAVKGSQQML